MWCHRAVAKKHRNRSARRSPHRTATRRPARSAGGAAYRDPIQDLELVQTLRRALRSPDPTAFLLAAAPIAQVIAEGEVDDDLPEGWVGLLESFCEVDIAETTALLHVIAALTPDELVRARLHRVLATRRQPVPGQVRTLGEVRAEGTMIMGGDPAGDNILVGLVWPGGEAATMVAYLARRPDVYLKDAFFVGDSLAGVAANFRQIVEADGYGPGHSPQPLDPAEARAAIERGLAGYDAMPDAPAPDADEMQQWPLCRALVEHVVPLLPAGGQGYDERRLLPGQLASLTAGFDAEALGMAGQGAFGDLGDLGDLDPFDDLDDLDDLDEVDPEEVWELTELFLASTHARRLPKDDVITEAVYTLLTLAATAEGSALHWCPNVLEWVLTQALVLDPLLDDETLERTVQVLPALVTWAGQASGEDPGVARALTSMIPTWAERMRQLRRDPDMVREREQLRARAALLDGDTSALVRLLLEDQVGGAEALADLDDRLLPAEELALERLPEDVHERAREVDEVLTSALQQLGEPDLGEEFLTACRRFLARAVEREPAVLRRRARADTTAAAIAWTVGRANELVGYSPAPVRTGDLMTAFGLSSPPSGRADSLTRAFGAPEGLFGRPLGDPGVLVARARAGILRRRDQLAEGR